MVFKIQKNSHQKIQTAMVRAVRNFILSPQQHYFVGHGKNILPIPHPCKCKQAQALPTLCGSLRMGIKDTRGGGDVDDNPKWNEDNQLEVEDDKQPEVDSHLVIVPSEQFFNKELELNEV
jgi:hypothetical protein